MTNEPQSITEEMGVHEQWYADAEKVTLETLPEFCQHVMGDYRHDYGTCVHAVAACALAAANAANGQANGGITGFQGGCVMWEFVKRWLDLKGPLRLVQYEEMLYPQYEEDFQKHISQEAATWLIEQAKSKLAEQGESEHLHPAVRAHWLSIADGNVPFGYRVTKA